MKTHGIVTISLLMISVCSIAQDRTSPVGVVPSIAVVPPMSGTPGDYSAQIMGVQYDYPGAVVTGAPYAADAITESVQMLVDGNRLRQRNEARLYRDALGRTRREQNFNVIGTWQVSGNRGEMVFIHDPIARQSFFLDPVNQTVRQLASPDWPSVTLTESGDYVRGSTSPVTPSEGPAGDVILAPALGSVPTHVDSNTQTTVNLGQQEIEGILALGSRTQMVIEANSIGNDWAITVTTERWFSPTLRAIVMSKYSDPRFGEIIYRLTNISQEEPDPDLFRVPDDYQVIEGGH